MIQKTIRDWGGVEFTTTEGAEQQTEWNDRTEYGVDGFNSIAELGANQQPIKAKTDFITVTQAVNLDTMESDISTNNGKNTYPALDATKVGFITVTQAVDLDAMELITDEAVTNTLSQDIDGNYAYGLTNLEYLTLKSASGGNHVHMWNTGLNAWEFSATEGLWFESSTGDVRINLSSSEINAGNDKGAINKLWVEETFAPIAVETKTDFITVTQAVNLDTIETNSDASKVITDFITVTQAVDLDTMETATTDNASDILDRDSLFKTPITSAGNYTTANKDADTKKTVYMTSGSTLTLDSTGLSVDFQQQLFNSTGSDITISSTDTIEGENVALTDGSFAYYTLVSAGVWLLSVGGRTEPAEWAVAVSDETTALTTGTAKTTFRMPFAMTLTEVRASVTTAPTGAALVVDINEGGTTVLSTKLSIDVSEKTSTTAATPAVISDSALADDAEITIDIDTVGSSVAGAGLKVLLIGTRS